VLEKLGGLDVTLVEVLQEPRHLLKIAANKIGVKLSKLELKLRESLEMIGHSGGVELVSALHKSVTVSKKVDGIGLLGVQESVNCSRHAVVLLGEVGECVDVFSDCRVMRELRGNETMTLGLVLEGSCHFGQETLDSLVLSGWGSAWSGVNGIDGVAGGGSLLRVHCCNLSSG